MYTSHVTRHTSHVTRHTSHVTRHTSHVTRHTSHVTRHTSHVTRHTQRSYYGYMALAAQCGSVYFFDPQPFCAQSIATAVIKNGFHRAYLVPYAVSSTHGKNLTLDKRYNCNGRWPIEQDERGVDAASAIIVQTVTLLQVLPGDLTHIYMAKVDTEGGELAVLHALMPFILKKKASW